MSAPRGIDTHDWRDASVLVTGATGFIGARLVRRLLAHGAQVHAFVCDHDPRSPLSLSGDVDRVRIVDGRLEDYGRVKAAVLERGVDTVFHLGAQTIVGVARRDPLGTFETNVRGTVHVLEACRVAGAGVRRIVVASSDKAYGDCVKLPYTEDTPLAGRYPYDASKACADLIAQSYAATFGLPVAVVRCGNVFGPGDLHWSRLVPGAIRSLLRGERPIVRSDGSLVRDYLHVDDAADGYLAVAGWLDRAESDDPGAFNLSTGRPLTVLEMLRHLRLAAGREDLEPVIENTARAEILAQHLDSSRAHRTLGWRPRRELEPALADTVSWYRRYLERYEPAADADAAPTPASIVAGRAGGGGP